MDDLPRQKLCEIVAHRKTLEVRAGRDILSDSKLCKAYLMDLCGEHKREVNVLTMALEERVAVDLLASRDGVPLEILLGRLTRRLLDHRALTERAARWAVESWAWLRIPMCLASSRLNPCTASKYLAVNGSLLDLARPG